LLAPQSQELIVWLLAGAQLQTPTPPPGHRSGKSPCDEQHSMVVNVPPVVVHMAEGHVTTVVPAHAITQVLQ
jgi:hypothetical protein